MVSEAEADIAIRRLQYAVRYAESDPNGGKVLLDLEVSRHLLKILKETNA